MNTLSIKLAPGLSGTWTPSRETQTCDFDVCNCTVPPQAMVAVEGASFLRCDRCLTIHVPLTTPARFPGGVLHATYYRIGGDTAEASEGFRTLFDATSRRQIDDDSAVTDNFPKADLLTLISDEDV